MVADRAAPGRPGPGAGGRDQRYHDLALAESRTPFGPGGIEAGSSHGTPPSRSKAGRVFWICTLAAGRAGPWAAGEYVLSADEKTSIQARVRRHASQPPAADRPMRVEHEYTAGVPGPTSRSGMCTGPRSSGGVRARRASRPSAAWWRRSCARNPIARPRACSGSSTMAPRIVASERRHGCRPSGPGSRWSTRRSTRVGSTRSRSTSRSSNARSYAQRLPQLGRRQGSPPPVSSPLRAGGHPIPVDLHPSRPGRPPGEAHSRTSAPCCLSPHQEIRHRNCVPEYLVKIPNSRVIAGFPGTWPYFDPRLCHSAS